MDVQSTQAALRSSGESIANGGGRKAQDGIGLQKDDFLRLLMSQMTHQNPLNPLDSAGMMEQFAQLGTMEQLTNINAQLESMGRTQAELARSNAYTYLDKDVTVKGGTARVSGGNAPAMNYRIPRDANVRVVITDAGNTPIRSLDLGFQGPGTHRIEWNALDGDGDRVRNGSYHYRVSAETDDGSPVPVDLYITGKVANVRFENGRQMLDMNGESYDARDVIAVSTESERRFGDREPKKLREDLMPMPPAKDRLR